VPVLGTFYVANLATDAGQLFRLAFGSDRRKFTYQTTVEVLREAFPRKKLFRRLRPVQGPTQTQFFSKGISQPGEVDLVLMP
jgi:hypothetical protein